MHKNNLYVIILKSMELSDVLRKLKNSEISLEEAEMQLRITNFELISDIARVDVSRTTRVGKVASGEMLVSALSGGGQAAGGRRGSQGRFEVELDGQVVVAQ